MLNDATKPFVSCAKHLLQRNNTHPSIGLLSQKIFRAINCGRFPNVASGMYFVHTLRTASAFPNFRDAVANQHKRRCTMSYTRQTPRLQPGSGISQSSGSGKRACGLESKYTPVSYSFGYRQSCKLHAFDPESEVRLENRVDVFQYQHKDDPLGQEQTGVIAQKLSNELPDTVVKDPATGLQSVKLDKLVAYATKGIQSACSALKELDAKHPIGMSILMQQQSDSTTQSNTSLAPKHTAPDFQSYAHSDDEPPLSASTSISVPPDASSDLKTGPVETQPPSVPLYHTSFADDATLIQHILLDLGEDLDNPKVHDHIVQLVHDLGQAYVWDAFCAAQHTSLLKQDGTKRSRGGTFFKLIQERRQVLKLRQTEEQETGRVHTSLHGYQKRLLDCVGKGGNHIIVAPTGSGKTRVAVELASLILERKPTACILFLTQTVALAEQQTGAFRAAQSIPSGVECFSSYNPISAHSWPLLIKHNRVLVMTAQVFLNLLEAGDASLDAFHLMVFDECHHTQKNNPFNKIALKYIQLTAEQQAHLQILGLTATPAVASSMTETHAQLDSLRSNLCATFLVVPHDDAEVRRVVGKTQEIMRQVEGRSEDVSFVMDLSRVLLNHFMQFAQHDLASQGAAAEISSSLIVAKGSGKLTGLLGTLSIDCPEHLVPNLQLLQVCNTALDLNKDTGFELPMWLLAGTCLAIQTPESQMLTQGSSEASQMEMKDSTAANTTGTCEMSETIAASMRQALMQDLASKVYKLQRSLDAVAGTQSGASSKFPKFQELVTVLTEMKDRKNAWHGIIFVKDRQSVHAIAAMLQEVSQLTNISFFTFTGQPSSNKGSRLSGPAQSAGLRSVGMKLHQQKNALLQFKEAQGMAILVSTAAAEEGLDIINCELVISYTMVETAREMIQKRGRARMAGSQFISIVEEHDQAKMEQAKMAEHYARVAQTAQVRNRAA